MPPALPDLPVELLLCIASFLDPTSTTAMALTCKTLNDTISFPKFHRYPEPNKFTMAQLLNLEDWSLTNQQSQFRSSRSLLHHQHTSGGKWQSSCESHKYEHIMHPYQYRQLKRMKAEINFLACSICLKLRSTRHFTNAMMRGPNSPYAPTEERMHRYCILCSIITQDAGLLDSGSWPFGGFIDSADGGKVLCRRCGARRERTGIRGDKEGNKDKCFDCEVTSDGRVLFCHSCRMLQERSSVYERDMGKCLYCVVNHSEKGSVESGDDILLD